MAFPLVLVRMEINCITFEPTKMKRHNGRFKDGQTLLCKYLSSELIAGESGDSQPLVFILSVQCLQLVIVGVGQPSVGRYVEDDHHFASENIHDIHLRHLHFILHFFFMFM